METRIQKRGHCQMCGRLHAANPLMAKHGYNVEHGWFQGVCPGAGYMPLEEGREQLDRLVADLRHWADRAEDEALQLEQREVDPEGNWESYRELGQRKRRLIPYADMHPLDQKRCRENAVHALQQKAKHMRQAGEDMLKLATQVHGQPLTEVTVGDQSKVIKVGDTVKVAGHVVQVVEIKYATARGVGPGINGHYVEHVFWNTAGGEPRGYPKRYARKVAP